MKPKSYALYVGKEPKSVYSWDCVHTIMPDELVGVFYGSIERVGIRKLGQNGEVVSKYSTYCDTSLLRILSPLELLALQAE